MGMSASQARLIALTARMNDIEYQGQQINQQRTTLSSQINALYNSLLDMDVPTPPSTQDFTKVVYSGTQDASKFNLDNVVPTGKNSSGKDTYSIDFKYQMAGHAVSKNTNSATITNTSHYLTYKSITADDVKSSLFTDVNKYKSGDQITKPEDLPEYDSNNPEAVDILIKTTVRAYNNLPNRTGLQVYDINGNEITNNIPSDNSTVIYVKTNTSAIKDEKSSAYALVDKTDTTTGEGDDAVTTTTYNNIYNVDKTTDTNIKSYLTDENIASLGLYYVENPGSRESVATLITSVDQLKDYLGSNLDNFSHIVKRDYTNQGLEYTNPNYQSSNSTGLSVGDMPVMEMKNAREVLGDSYDDYITALKHSFPELAKLSDEEIADKFYVYIEKTSSGTNVPHFIKKDEMSAFNNNDSTSVRSYEYDEDGTYTNTENKKNCELEFDVSTGRITKVGIPDGNGQVIWVDIKAETVTDDVAYNDAFNEYEYKKHLYDKQQKEINAKTSIIQAEDKNLELKLTRLDNERNAVNTEIEAVKKVVDDNIQKSFKTFSG
jgi:hypothetical protein